MLEILPAVGDQSPLYHGYMGECLVHGVPEPTQYDAGHRASGHTSLQTKLLLSNFSQAVLIRWVRRAVLELELYSTVNIPSCVPGLSETCCCGVVWIGLMLVESLLTPALYIAQTSPQVMALKVKLARTLIVVPHINSVDGYPSADLCVRNESHDQ